MNLQDMHPYRYKLTCDPHDSIWNDALTSYASSILDRHGYSVIGNPEDAIIDLSSRLTHAARIDLFNHSIWVRRIRIA